MVKDEDELKVMREAALVGCRLFDHILGLLRPGIERLAVSLIFRDGLNSLTIERPPEFSRHNRLQSHFL